MTPCQAAKAHCANYQPDRSCLGIAFRDDLSMHRFRKEGSLCALHLSPCEACPYFEEIVLPQVPASVAEEYRKSLPAGAETTLKPQRGIMLCPDCHKRELGPRQRYCAICARTRKRESKRRHMRRKRGSDVEKLANSPIDTEALTKPETQGRYNHPKTSIQASSFSTREARVAP
jgi:hypothetical protein